MTDRKPSFVVTALLVAAVSALWLGLWGQLLILTPRMKQRFDDFGLQLPAATKLMLGLGAWAWDNWWLVVPAVFAGVAVFGGVIGWLRHRRGWTAAVSILAILMLVGLAAGNLIVATSLLLPEAKLREGLAK